MEIRRASLEDAAEILDLQKAAYQSEAEIYNDFNIQPLRQTLIETEREFAEQVVLKAIDDGRIVGSIRGYLKDGTCNVGKVIVRPEMQNRGLGTKLLQAIEEAFPETERFELFTGFRSERNLYLYQKLGYRIFEERPLNKDFSMIFLEKTRSAQE